MTEGARRQCRLALTRKNTETHDELQLALFSSNHWSEESRQVKTMNELLSKLSSYNLFNYLLPGVVFSITVEAWTTYSISRGDLLSDAFVFYFAGLVISRIGSLLVEPALKKLHFVTFVDYPDFVAAAKQDPQIEILSEVNNTYRTILSALLLVLIAKIYSAIEPFCLLMTTLRPYMIAVGLVALFLFSYRKQTQYVAKRVNISK